GQGASYTKLSKRLTCDRNRGGNGQNCKDKRAAHVPDPTRLLNRRHRPTGRERLSGRDAGRILPDHVRFIAGERAAAGIAVIDGDRGGVVVECDRIAVAVGRRSEAFGPRLKRVRVTALCRRRG